MSFNNEIQFFEQRPVSYRFVDRRKKKEPPTIVVEVRRCGVSFIDSRHKSGLRFRRRSIVSSVFPVTRISCGRERHVWMASAFPLFGTGCFVCRRNAQPSPPFVLLAGFSRYCREIGVTGIPRIERIDVLEAMRRPGGFR